MRICLVYISLVIILIEAMIVFFNKFLLFGYWVYITPFIVLGSYVLLGMGIYRSENNRTTLALTYILIVVILTLKKMIFYPDNSFLNYFFRPLIMGVLTTLGFLYSKRRIAGKQGS